MVLQNNFLSKYQCPFQLRNATWINPMQIKYRERAGCDIYLNLRCDFRLVCVWKNLFAIWLFGAFISTECHKHFLSWYIRARYHTFVYPQIQCTALCSPVKVRIIGCLHRATKRGPWNITWPHWNNNPVWHQTDIDSAGTKAGAFWDNKVNVVVDDAPPLSGTTQ